MFTSQTSSGVRPSVMHSKQSREAHAFASQICQCQARPQEEVVRPGWHSDSQASFPLQNPCFLLQMTLQHPFIISIWDKPSQPKLDLMYVVCRRRLKSKKWPVCLLRGAYIHLSAARGCPRSANSLRSRMVGHCVRCA